MGTMRVRVAGAVLGLVAAPAGGRSTGSAAAQEVPVTARDRAMGMQTRLTVG
jgi:hypothetical protein